MIREAYAKWRVTPGAKHALRMESPLSREKAGFIAGWLAAKRTRCRIHPGTRLRCPACTAARNTGSTPARRKAAQRAWRAAVKIRRRRARLYADQAMGGGL